MAKIDFNVNKTLVIALTNQILAAEKAKQTDTKEDK